MAQPLEKQLERYTFVHALPVSCITEINGARRAILPIFKMGTTDLADGRGSFRMDEGDFGTLKTNLAKKQTPTPVLFEHAKGPRGGLAGGKVISLQEKTGEIFAHATLTKKAYEECKAEEWLSCSGGFLASRDEDGAIRPAEILEISFTNLPAFPGLSNIQTFAVLTPEEAPMTQLTEAEKPVVEAAPAPSEPAIESATLEATPAPEPVPETVNAQISSNSPPAHETPVATPAPEPEPVSAPEPPPPPPPPAPEPELEEEEPAAPAEPELPVMAAESEGVIELTADQTESVIELAATARFNDKVKAEAIVVLMALGEAEGKITPANKSAMQSLCTADHEAFRTVLATMKPILPVKRTIGDAVVVVDLGLLDTSPEHEAAILSKAVQLKAKHPELSLAELSMLVKKHTV